MHNQDSTNPGQSATGKNNPEILAGFFAKMAELEALQLASGKMTEAELEELKRDPIERARETSPLLQYLAATQEAPTLPDADVGRIPSPVTVDQLPLPRDFDWGQAVRQIEALGFEEGDKCYIRLLPAKNIPEKVKKELWLANGKDFYLELLPCRRFQLVPFSWEETGELKPDGTPKRRLFADTAKSTFKWSEELAKWNKKGYGVYLVPSKGGRKKDEITHFQTAFYEIDDRSLPQQQAQIKDFEAKTGIKTTVIVRTRQGFHVYFKFKKSEWQLPNWGDEVQKPTILAMQSDPAIFNNDRLMRLAGFYHVKYDLGNTEFNFVPVELVKCSPDEETEYTRQEYLQALEKYSGLPYSEFRHSALNKVNSPSVKDYLYLDDQYKLLPKNHQICQCPDELAEELFVRIELYLNLLKQDLKGEDVTPTDAWTEDVKDAINRNRINRERYENSDYQWDDEEGEPDVVRWAQYLYGYNPHGRDGWITAQDPLIPESEQENHSIDSLHISFTGAFKSHRGGDTKDIYAAMKERAFAANPEEEILYKAKQRKRKRAQGFAPSKKLEGEISKEEYKAKKLKAPLTQQEEDDKNQYKELVAVAKREHIDQEYQDYLDRIKLNKSIAQRYYTCNENYLSDKTFAQFPSIKECRDRGQLLALKAPKGTGKSTRIKQYIQQAKEDRWLVVSVTPRINLGVGQAHEWGIKWIHEDGIQEFIDGGRNDMSCCWDSLHKFEKMEYRNKQVLFIIDEVESGLEHLSLSSTFKGKGNRARVYAQLRRLIQHIRECGGLIIAADADLTNISVNFLKLLGKDLPVTIIENTFLAEKLEIPVYHGEFGEVQVLVKDALEFGLPFLFACDGKEKVKDMHKYAVEFLGKNEALKDQVDRLWCIHAENANDEDNQRRLKDINKAIRDEQPIAVFFSPTITVGLSIDERYFNEGFGLFSGTVIPDVARQMVGRNRETIQWVIFADNKARNDLKGDNVATTPEGIAFDWHQQIQGEMEILEWQTQKLLKEEDWGDSEKLLEAELAMIKRLKAGYVGQDLAEFQLYCDVLARRNFQMKHYHKCFCAGMESEGWKVVSKKGTKNSFSKELQELRERRRKEESEVIASADHTLVKDAEEAREIVRTSRDKALVAAAHKVSLADKCGLAPVEMEAEIVQLAKFDHRWFQGVKTEWLIRNPDIAKKMGSKQVTKFIKDFVSCGVGSIQDVTSKTQEYEQIKKLGIFDIIDVDDCERSYTKKDFQPILDSLKFLGGEKIENWSVRIGIGLPRVKVIKKLKAGEQPPFARSTFFRDPITYIVKPILAKLGYSFGKVKSGAKGIRYYGIPQEEINDTWRARVQEGLTQKWLKSQEQQEIRLAASSTIKLSTATLLAPVEGQLEVVIQGAECEQGAF
jgi:hypothetical protein